MPVAQVLFAQFLIRLEPIIQFDPTFSGGDMDLVKSRQLAHKAQQAI